MVADQFASDALRRAPTASYCLPLTSRHLVILIAPYCLCPCSFCLKPTLRYKLIDLDKLLCLAKLRID